MIRSTVSDCMKPSLIVLGIVSFWQVTPAYRARQLNTEGTALVRAGRISDPEADPAEDF